MRAFGNNVQAELMRNITANGTSQIFWYCPDCKKHCTKQIKYIDHKKVTGWNGTKIEDIPTLKDYRHSDTKCAVLGCNRLDVELHHFAPKHLFGEQIAELWPQAYLCKYHHDLWHNLVDKIKEAVRL